MATLAARAALPDRRSWTLAVFIVLAGVDLLAAFAMAAFTPDITVGEVLVIAAAAAIGVAAAFAFARAVETSSVATRTVWIARGLGFVGAAFDVWMTAIVFGELRFVAGDVREEQIVAREVLFGLLTLPFMVVPIIVATRLPVAGGVLFVLMSAYNVVQGIYDPTGSFPERTVSAMAIISAAGPSLVVGIALIVGGLAMRHAPREASFAEWLRALRLGDRALD